MKRIVLFAGGGLLLYLLWIAVSLALLPPVSTLADPRATMTITVRDWKGGEHPFVVGPGNRFWTPLSRMPITLRWAVILAEDAHFYLHEGVDVEAVKNAVKYDIEKGRFARGASTITQQAAKNLFLSREKTITRKLKELYLAVRMEQELSKGRILELYLNLVELGPMVYGIGHGSRYYFGKPPAALTPREASFLAAMLPGPRIAYNPYRNLDKVLRRSDMILGLMRSKGILSESQYREALVEIPNIARLKRRVERTVEGTPPVQERTSSARAAAGARPEGEPPSADGANAPEASEEKKAPAGGSDAKE